MTLYPNERNRLWLQLRKEWLVGRHVTLVQEARRFELIIFGAAHSDRRKGPPWDWGIGARLVPCGAIPVLKDLSKLEPFGVLVHVRKCEWKDGAHQVYLVACIDDRDWKAMFPAGEAWYQRSYED